MEEKRILLSRRLQMLADMVTPGSRVADVGCDHGFLSIYLVQAEIAPRVIAMDVREGPLRAAREHIHVCGMEPYIETRLSDGLTACRIGEVDTMVCAGMGGRLMERILRESVEQVRGLRELILQPQSEWEEFRIFLRENGFVADREDMVAEAGKYYPAMRVSWRGGRESLRCENLGQGSLGRENLEQESPEKKALGQKNPECGAGPDDRQKLYDMFGKGLLESCHPVLGQYLEYRRKALAALQERLAAQGTQKAQAGLEKIKIELSYVERALEFFEGKAGGKAEG